MPRVLPGQNPGGGVSRAEQYPPRVLLSLDQVVRQFAALGRPAVDGLSLELYEGELLALLGPSGCGKTTLLRLIAGLERPDGGSIVLAGRSVAGPGGWVAPERRQVGMVFQDYALFPHLNVFENVAFGLHSRRKQAPELVRTRVAEAIALVHLEGLERRYPHELSGGQQQRVALARALAPAPALVLLDEPMSNLDAQVRGQLRQDIRRVLKAAGTTGILVTHDREEAMAIADRIALLRAGQLEQIDRPEALYWQPASRFVAEFVARANILRARRSPQGWESALGRLAPARVASPSPTLEQASEIDLVVYPTDLSLGGTLAPGEEPGDRAVGTITSRQFLGRNYAYQVALIGGETVEVLSCWRDAFAVGERVAIAWVAEQLYGFPSP